MATSGEHTNPPTRKRPSTEVDRPTELFCRVVAIDYEKLFYLECKVCGKAAPDNFLAPCRFCIATTTYNPSISGYRRVYRVLMSIATHSKVFVVIMFDRVARVLFGCSADDFFDFAMTHPYAAYMANWVLEGEFLAVTLAKPKDGNAQHMRVKSAVPMRCEFQPAIHTLREYFSVSDCFKYQPGQVRALGIIAGGSGITQMFRLARAVLENPSDKTKVHLIYANVMFRDILLKDKLDSLARNYPDSFKIYYVLNHPPEKWEGGVGMVSKEMIQEHLPSPASDIQIVRCGPQEMKEGVAAHLEALGYASETLFRL